MVDWIVYFVAIGLELPPGMTAKFNAKFTDKETCELWVDEVESKEPPAFQIISECTLVP